MMNRNERRKKRKAIGLCRDCPNPTVGDGVLCLACSDRHRARRRAATGSHEWAPARRGRPPKSEIERLRQVWRTLDWRKSDDELANIMGCQPRTVRKWRPGAPKK